MPGTLKSLPIVRRELLVASRKRLTFWSRILAALGGFFAVLFIVGIEPDFMTAGALGAKLFRCLTWPAFAACLFGSTLLTADCLSMEKREGTLGLLFLTDLKGYDVVLGKFVAKSMTAVFCLLAIVPMLAFPILLGGVTAGNFWRVVLALLNTAFLSLSIGMLASVRCRDPRNVFAVSLFLIFLLAIVPEMIGSLLPLRWRFISATVSPVFAFVSVMPGRFGPAPVSWWPLLVQHLLGWTCLLIASLMVQTSWQERPNVGRALNRWREFLRGNAMSRLALRRQLLPINPMLWIESRDWLLRVGLGLLLLFLAVLCWFLNNNGGLHWWNVSDAIITMVLLHLIITLLIAFDAGSRLVNARQDGALEVILSTRLSVEEILRGEFLALKRLFRWPLRAVLIFDVVWLGFVIRHGHGVQHAAAAVVVALCLSAMLFAHFSALTWTAFYNGMRSKRPHRAALRAAFTVLVIPFSLFGILASTGALNGSLIGGMFAFTLINVANAFIFGKGAHERLKNEFRKTLTEHEAPAMKDFGEDFALLR
jgi:hypothetical protein